MSFPTPSLKEFAQATPVCEQTSGLADVLEIFRASECDAIIVVSPQYYPVGVVNLPKLMPYLIGEPQPEDTPRARTLKQSKTPLSELEPTIIEPLVILPAQLSLSQFWNYLQEGESGRVGEQAVTTVGRIPTTQSTTKKKLSPPYPRTSSRCAITPGLRSAALSPRQQWALVDEEGKFLGLLNHWLLLKSLAPQFVQSRTSDSDEQPQLITLKPLVQLLEHLPLPLSIQTTTGQVLAQNLTWRQQIGTAPNLDWVRRTTAAMLDFPLSERASTGENRFVSDGCTPLHSEAGNTPCESLLSVSSLVEQRCNTSEQVAVQRFCAIDTPRLATTVSTQQVILAAPPMSKTQDSASLCEASTPGSETAKRSQERVFSCIKIPLSPSVFECRQAQENEPDFTASAYHPSIFDLCIVLAQDTTEQQQVAKELAAKNADLVQLNRLKDEFLACISHELKTPLTAVLGLSTLLKDQALGELNERQARYARLIYQSGRQLMTLVNDILDLTRMETGQLELTLEPVQIHSVCDRAYSQASQHQHEKDHEEEATATKFTLEVELGVEMVIADELRLRQMLVHLLSNALKFTDAGGEMGLRVNRWEGWIAFTVWDTGIGIPPEKQHLIFQKFQQLEQPLTRRFEGTGLGLVLTQRLARLHGGDVSFISKAGEGSEFTLLLPPCPPQARRTEGEIPQCPIPNPDCPIRNRLVLIVETVTGYLNSLTQQLESLGYRVVIARSGTEAIEKARGLQPRVILLNPLLPQLSGWDVLTLLKSDAQTHHIPVLVTATQAEKHQAYQNKADGFLSLPVQKQALQQILTDLEEPQTPTPRKGLTILHLSPVETCPHTSVHLQSDSDSSNLCSGLTDILSLEHSELNYRVLEADDLEQAELLARVWHPDVILLDAAKMADSFAYLQQFALHTDLISIPLVTLDHQTTQAANQVSGLSVYPCLAPENSSKMSALLQVIQVAAGLSRMPSIMVMDIGDGELTDRSQNPQSQFSSSPSLTHKTGSLSSPQTEESHRAGSEAVQQNSPTTDSVARPLHDRFTSGDRTQHTALISDNPALLQSLGAAPLGIPFSSSGVANGHSPYSLSSTHRQALPSSQWREAQHRQVSIEEGLVSLQGESRTQARRSRGIRSAGSKRKPSQTATPVTPQSSWLQALMQYLQTAGLKSVLSSSWTQLYRQLQEQSIDLLLIHVKDISDSSALVNELICLTQLPKLPPILVLDHRLNAVSQVAPEELTVATPGLLQAHDKVTLANDSTSTLDSLLNAVATQILRGHSLSMSQLLEQINQALGM